MDLVDLFYESGVLVRFLFRTIQAIAACFFVVVVVAAAATLVVVVVVAFGN